MRLEEILKLARGMNIQTAGLSKTDMIRGFQRAEGNIDCFGTERIRVCQEKACLWKTDCMTLTNTRKPLPHVDEFFVGSNKSSVRNLSIISHLFLSVEI